MRTLLIWLDDWGTEHSAIVTHPENWKPWEHTGLLSDLLEGWRTDDSHYEIELPSDNEFRPAVLDTYGNEIVMQFVAID